MIYLENKRNEVVSFTMEQSIIHRLMLESSFIKDPGLFYGKMGIAISIYDYGRFKNNSIFIDCADELIDVVLDDIGKRTSFDFATGLSGIGWGVEYLSQNNYIECDTNQICAELDERIMLLSLKRMTDLSIETGLEGILHYVLARFKGSVCQGNIMPFEESFMHELLYVVGELKTKKVSKNVELLMCNVSEMAMYSRSNYEMNVNEICIKTDSTGIVSNTELGLQNGLAGKLYKYIDK